MSQLVQTLDPTSSEGQPAPEYANAMGADSRLSSPTNDRPSLLRYAPAIVVLLAVIADAGQKTDPDLWGHLLYGEATLRDHWPTLADPYSYSAFGAPWHNHEWLTEALMAFLYGHLGVVGLKLWKFACAGGTILMLAIALAETGASADLQLGVLTVAAVALMPQMQFRPQLFTFLLFAALMALLARHNYRRAGPLWLAIPLMMLWGNLHGGYLIGVATLIAFTGVVAMQDLLGGRGLREVMPLALITAASTLATAVSPYGIDNWRFVLSSLHFHAARNVVLDWQPLTHAMLIQWHAGQGGIVYYLLAVGMMAAFVVTFMMRPAGGDLPIVAIAALMSLGAVVAMRNIPLAVIACAIPVARHWSLIRDGRDASISQSRSGVNQYFVAGVAVLVAIDLGLFSTHIATEQPYPSGAVDFMETNHLRGNVLVDFNWAEYFLWHERDSKVFFDGRYETIYSIRILDQYLAFYFGKPGARAVLHSYPHQFVLIPPQVGAYRVMTGDGAWRLIYKDRTCALFARSDLAAAQGVPVTGAATRREFFP